MKLLLYLCVVVLFWVPVIAQEPAPVPTQEPTKPAPPKVKASETPKQPEVKASEAPRQPEVTIPAHEPTRLKDIKKIYIDEMPNGLDKYIQAEMVKKFKGKIMPVQMIEDADAILTGTGEHKSGTGAAITGRWLGLHDTATGAVTLLCKHGDHFIWADEAGDRSLFWGVLTRGGPRKVASRLMKHLDKAIKKDRKNR